MKKKIKLIIALLIVIALIIIYNFTPLKNLLNLNRLIDRKDELINFIKLYYLQAVIIFILIYLVSVALSIPGATILSLLGGFFFGPFLGTLYINLGATGGAVLVFFASRFLLGETVQQKYQEKLTRFNAEIAANGKNYLLTLRLIPIFPFFLINLLAGFTKVSGFTFYWTTAVGIIPGSFVYAYLGYSGASLGAAGKGRIQIIIALSLLAALSLIPVLIKKLKGRPKGEVK